jgi:uncharacterized membrane protein
MLYRIFIAYMLYCLDPTKHYSVLHQDLSLVKTFSLLLGNLNYKHVNDHIENMHKD